MATQGSVFFSCDFKAVQNADCRKTDEEEQGCIHWCHGFCLFKSLRGLLLYIRQAEGEQ